jgi:hypothetical protein
MKSLSLALILMFTLVNANAADAYLVSCRHGRSVTGQFIYIGTYRYNSTYFERSFLEWCPFTVDVY